MPPESAITSIAVWVGIAVVLVLVGGLAVRRLRNWVRRDDSAGALTMQDLRDMRDRGQITPEEYEVMRQKLIARYSDSPAPAPHADEPDAPG